MYRIAVIGAGDMGTKHAAAWGAREDAEIAAVCDHNDDRAQRLAEPHSATIHKNYLGAITLEGVDIVSICVPACDHAEIAVAAAEAGKHVLCEKSMALTLREADRMIAAARANGVQLLVCHQYRALNRSRLMKELITSGRLGSPIYMRFSEMREVRPKLAMHRRSMNGGPVHDMTGHLFDLARYLTGAEAETVTATGGVFSRGKPRLAAVEDFGVDTAEIQVRFSGGHCLSIGLSWGFPEDTPGHSQELIWGPLAMMATVDPENPDRFLGDVSPTVGLMIKGPQGTEVVKPDGDVDGPHACIDELIAAVETGRTSQFDATQGRAALALILATIESIETGKTVDLR